MRYIKHALKKLRYDPVFVFEISQDKEYYFKIFAFIYLKEGNIHYLPKLRKSGDYTMLCPFHKEKSPSLRINAKNNYFKCFGCGKGGDVIRLYQLYFRLSFIEAIQKMLSFKKVPLLTKERVSFEKKMSDQVVLDFSEPVEPTDDDLPF